MPQTSSKLCVVALLAFAMSGCAFATRRVDNLMNSWVGHHYSELIMGWGPPQGVYDDGEGGRILVWTQSRQWTTPGTVTTTTSLNARAYDNVIWGQASSLSTFTPAVTNGYVAYRMFQIDRDGRVYNWSWRGF